MARCINCNQDLQWDSDLAWKHLILKDCFDSITLRGSSP